MSNLMKNLQNRTELFLILTSGNLKDALRRPKRPLYVLYPTFGGTRRGNPKIFILTYFMLHDQIQRRVC